MGTLQRPTLVATGDVPFEGTRILVRCMPGKDLPGGDAEKVCRHVAELFRQQGAECETQVPRDADEGIPADAFEGKGPDLTMDIVSRTEHSYDYPALAVFSAYTCTAIPSIEEGTYRQEVLVRGRNQTVLASETYRARFVDYNSCVVWSLNWVLDFLFRSDEQKVSGDAAKRNYSRDFYRQLTQLAFNARVRSDVLGLTQAPARAPIVGPATGTAPAAPATAQPAPAPPSPPSPPSPTPVGAATPQAPAGPDPRN